MRFRIVLTIIAGAFAAAAAQPSHALCAGFTDVDGALASCSDVTWIRNRGITLGCNPPANDLYCPDLPVSRLAMALFMRRLGDVLSPAPVGIEAQGGALGITTASLLCETPQIGAASYERTFVGTATLSFIANGDSRIDVALARSQSGGPFQPGIDSTVTVLTGAPGQAVALHRGTIDAGDTVRYAVRVVRTAGTASTAQLTDWKCSLQGHVINRNP